MQECVATAFLTERTYWQNQKYIAEHVCIIMQEMMEAEARPSSESSSKRKRRLPAGMSDYQAAWILEEDLPDGEDSASDAEAADTDRHRGDAEPSLGDLNMDGAVSMADLDEEDDQTDDMLQSIILRCCTKCLLYELPLSPAAKHCLLLRPAETYREPQNCFSRVIHAQSPSSSKPKSCSV